MKERTFLWIEDRDLEFVKKVREHGVNRTARESGCSPALISRWINKHAGLELKKYDRVRKLVK